MQRIHAAVLRDLKDWYGERAQEAYDSWGHGLLSVFQELSSGFVWRSAALVPGRGGGHALWERADAKPIIEWLSHILEPWLAGKSNLNAHVLLGVYEALLANPGRLWGSEMEIRDADGRRALEQYAQSCGKAERARLEAALGPEELGD
jgi:hypothetical protein